MSAEPTPDPAPVADLFTRVVTALRPSLPFDRSELVLLEDEESTRAFELGADPADPARERRGLRRDYSARLWPDGEGSFVVVGDAAAELDPTAPADREMIDAGVRSLLAAPLRVRGRSVGLVALASRTDSAFNGSQAGGLSPMLEILGMAIERERAWALEQARHERRAKLAALLPTIAEALDVRQVFLSLAAAIQEIVPHDILAFARLTPDRKAVRVQAATHQGLRELPEYRFSNEQEALDYNWNFLLAYDLTPAGEEAMRARITPRDAPEPKEVIVRPGADWVRFFTQAGVRSTLRAPVRSQGRPVGGIVFLAFRPDAFDAEDGALASRIADHVALAIAHQSLADEERRIAQAEARAEVLEARVDVLSRELDRFTAHRAIGRSTAWKRALADATRVAATDATVLITGESGTGKEVLARFIHRGSPRADGPFAAINCAALPAELLESELFGHERGAFTGAHTSRAGTIERAAGGVLFLDEVGEMSPPVQAKFLRVLQEREFQRLGGGRTLKADVRVVAATNRDPRRAMAAGELREDLYYRLGVFEIHLPPLRDRPEDILVLAEAFVEELASNIGRPAAGISEDARELLLAHTWPGNVRELRNAIERAVILCHGGLITRDHLPVSVVPAPLPELPAGAPGSEAFPVTGISLDSVEHDLLEKALAKTRGNKSRAAKLLGLTRGQLYSLLRKHGLTTAKR